MTPDHSSIDPSVLIAALECAGDAIEITDREGRLVYVNAAFEEQTGFPRSEALGRTPAELTRSPVETPELFEDAWRTVSSGKTWHGEFTRLRRDQALILVEVTLSPIVGQDGASTMIVAVSRDITRRREVEEGVARSLAEKEALLREIHHRVKNNLQVVSSILSMSSETAKSEDARTALTDSVYRVRSMALILQQLYGHDSLERIDLGAYVETLSQSLRSATSSDARVAVQAPSVIVTIDLAIPMGLILNELITNALKHGTSEPRPADGVADVVVRIEREGPLLVVEVLDSGPGLPAGIDLSRGWRSSTSLGLKLVAALCSQIRAKPTVLRAPNPGVRLALSVET